MNQYLLYRKLSQDIQDAALKEFSDMSEVYPQLDPTTCRHVIADDGGVFAAVVGNVLNSMCGYPVVQVPALCPSLRTPSLLAKG